MPQQFENPANPGNPPPHHGRGNLERYGRQSRRGGLRRRHRRHHHRRRPGAEDAQARREDDRVEPEERRCCRAASPARTRSRASARASCLQSSTAAVIDEVITVSTDGVRNRARGARLEGIPVGISSGAAVAAASKSARGPKWRARTSCRSSRLSPNAIFRRRCSRACRSEDRPKSAEIGADRIGRRESREHLRRIVDGPGADLRPSERASATVLGY